MASSSCLCQCIIPAWQIDESDFRCAALNPTECRVIPAYGDPNGSHVTIKVVSAAFEGKRAVQRQQMVYKVSLLALHTTLFVVPYR